MHAYLPQRAITAAVISLLSGGFSPRPSECNSSWMMRAAASPGFRRETSANCVMQMNTARLPGDVAARMPRAAQMGFPLPS